MFVDVRWRLFNRMRGLTSCGLPKYTLMILNRHFVVFGESFYLPKILRFKMERAVIDKVIVTHSRRWNHSGSNLLNVIFEKIARTDKALSLVEKSDKG